MSSGWIKLHRVLLKKKAWRRASKAQKVLIITCLLKANHKPADLCLQGGESVGLKPGDFWTSQENLAEDAEISRQELRTSLTNLKKLKFLTIKSTKQGTKISIVNWKTYQSAVEDVNQPPNQRLTNGQPTPNHEQECKKDKKVNNKIISCTDRGEFQPVTEVDLEAWKKAYPLVDVPGELLRLGQWWKANPKKVAGRTDARKTIVNCLSRKQTEKEAAGGTARDSRGGDEHAIYDQ